VVDSQHVTHSNSERGREGGAREEEGGALLDGSAFPLPSLLSSPDKLRMVNARDRKLPLAVFFNTAISLSQIADRSVLLVTMYREQYFFFYFFIFSS